MASDQVATGKLARLQTFTMEVVSRKDIKEAPYNPRQITEVARTKLRTGLQKVGLVQPLVWNKRTGNLVGGHQRLKELDRDEKSRDYSLTVAAIDVDEPTEKAINVLLNNQDVAGDWDLPKLKEILDSKEFDIEKSGFDWAAFAQMFGEAPSQPKEEHQREIMEGRLKACEAYAKLHESHATKDDTDFYCVVVFGSYGDRKEFLDEFGFDDNRYIDGRTLVKVFREVKASNGR